MIKTIAALLIALFCLNAFADDNITIEADEVTAQDNSTYKAIGNVVIMKDNSTMTADEVIYNKETGEVDARGQVRLREGVSYFDCSRLIYNFNDEKGTFYNAKGFVEPYHYLEADKFERVGEKNFLIENGRFTTCGEDVPDWSFTASKATMDIGKYIRATNTAGWIKNVPVLYTPYFVYPIKEERESGFLIPKLGSSSTRGSMLGLQYFKDINIDKDATIGTNIYTSGIVHYLGEFRYAKSSDEKVYLYGEYLEDWKSQSDKTNRYLVYQDTNFSIGNNTEIFIETDYVSDYRYLRDIADTDMIGGYDNPDNKFYADLRIVHSTTYADFGIRLKNDMQFTDIDNGYKKTEVYRSPNIFVRKNLRFGILGINYKTDFDNIRYQESVVYPFEDDSKNAIMENYLRLHSTLEFYVPIDVRFATVKPFVEVMATRWSDFEEAGDVQESGNGTFAEITVDGDTIDRRTYSLGYEIALNEIYKKYSRFRHTVYNILKYEEIPDLDQSTIPERIEDDLIEGTKSYTYTLRNYFEAENWKLNATLEQSYDTMLTDNQFRPLVAKFDYDYNNSLQLYLRHEYDYNSRDTSLLNQKATLKFKRVTFDEEYLYEDKDFTDDLENTSLEFSLGLTLDKFDILMKAKTSGKNDYLSLDNLKSVSHTIQGSYKSGCWDMGVSLTFKEYRPIEYDGGYSEREQILYFIVTLRGLGSLKGPVSTIRTSNRVDN